MRSHDFSRYAATLFVPAAQRRALLAIYAFNVEICRVRDQVSLPLPGEMRLQWWTDVLAGAGHGGVDGNPVAAELLLAIEKWPLRGERLSRMIDEHQFNLYNDPMPTMAALEGYIDDTCSALFSLSAAIVARPSAETEHLASHAGLAQGLAQVISALPVDAARRRLFVPLQMLESHGSGLEEVFAGQPTPRLRAALGQLIEARESIGRRPSRCWQTHRRRSSRCFCRWSWSTTSSGRWRATTATCSRPKTHSRLRILWTLWRASRSRLYRA